MFGNDKCHRESQQMAIKLPHHIHFLLVGCALIPGCGGEFVSASHREMNQSVSAVDDIVDLGEVDLTKSLERTVRFTIRNPTDAQLAIREIRTSCGCMIVGDYDPDLPPDSELEVVINIRVAPEPGVFSKIAIVDFESREQKPIALRVIGHVNATDVLRGDPPQLDLGEINAILPKEVSDSHARYAQVSRYDQKPFAIYRLDVDNDIFSVDLLNARRGRSSDLHTIVVKVENIGALKGSVQGIVSVYAKHTDIPLLIPLKVEIVNIAQFFKESIVLNASELNGASLIEIRNQRTAPAGSDLTVKSVNAIETSLLTVRQVTPGVSSMVAIEINNQNMPVVQTNLVASIGVNETKVNIPVTVISP